MKAEIASVAHSTDRSEACARITAALPDWFGLEEYNRRYIEDAARYDALAARTDDGIIIGLLVHKARPASKALADAIDIHWLGVLPEFHRLGIGTDLISGLSQLCTAKGIALLTVETLDPSVGDPNYLKTFAFYEKLGFRILEHFNFESGDPAVRMARRCDTDQDQSIVR